MVHWKKPVAGLVKLNVDAAVRPVMESFGVIGAIVRDSDGTILACLSKPVYNRVSPHLAECVAPQDGLEFEIQMA